MEIVHKFQNKNLSKFNCVTCGRNLISRRNLKRHMSTFHGVEEDKEPKKSFPCNSCNAVFEKPYSLRKHQRKEHPQQPKLHKCVICSLSLRKKELVTHFKTEHNIEVGEVKFEFPSLDDFYKWKEEEEKVSMSKFTKLNGTQCRNDKATIRFECHRSGYYQKSGRNLRKIKSMGSNKINTYCPASIKVTQTKDGKCTILYTNTHVGHENDLLRIPVSSKDKEAIAAKIASNIPFREILEEFRHSSNSKTERLQLLRRKDLHNIAQMYNLSSFVRQSENSEIGIDAEGVPNNDYVSSVEGESNDSPNSDPTTKNCESDNANALQKESNDCESDQRKSSHDSPTSYQANSCENHSVYASLNEFNNSQNSDPTSNCESDNLTCEDSVSFSLREKREELKNYCNSIIDSLTSTEELDIARNQMSFVIPRVTALRNNVEQSSISSEVNNGQSQNQVIQPKSFILCRQQQENNGTQTIIIVPAFVKS